MSVVRHTGQVCLQVLATFDNGRIEEFLEMRPLKPEEMAKKATAEQIAVRLKQFHEVEVAPKEGPQLFPTINRW